MRMDEKPKLFIRLPEMYKDNIVERYRSGMFKPVVRDGEVYSYTNETVCKTCMDTDTECHRCPVCLLNDMECDEILDRILGPARWAVLNINMVGSIGYRRGKKRIARAMLRSINKFIEEQVEWVDWKPATRGGIL